MDAIAVFATSLPVRASKLEGALPDARCKESDQGTELIVAVKENRVAAVTQLLNAGCSAQVTRQDGASALHVAAGRKHIELVRILLDAGANVNACSRFSDKRATPLHYACSTGNLDLVNLLVERGASKGTRDTEQALPLHRAALNGHCHIVEHLWDNSWDDRAAKVEANCALVLAAGNGKAKCAEWLIGQKQADPNCVSDDGSPVVNVAAMHGRVSVVAALLQHGAECTGSTLAHMLDTEEGFGKTDGMVTQGVIDRCGAYDAIETLLQKKQFVLLSSSLEKRMQMARNATDTDDAASAAKENENAKQWYLRLWEHPKFDTLLQSVILHAPLAAKCLFEAMVVPSSAARGKKHGWATTFTNRVTTAVLKDEGMRAEIETLSSVDQKQNGVFWHEKLAGAGELEHANRVRVTAVQCEFLHIVQNKTLLQALVKSRSYLLFDTLAVRAKVSFYWRSFGLHYFRAKGILYLVYAGLYLRFAFLANVRNQSSEWSDAFGVTTRAIVVVLSVYYVLIHVVSLTWIFLKLTERVKHRKAEAGLAEEKLAEEDLANVELAEVPVCNRDKVRRRSTMDYSKFISGRAPSTLSMKSRRPKLKLTHSFSEKLVQPSSREPLFGFLQRALALLQQSLQEHFIVGDPWALMNLVTHTLVLALALLQQPPHEFVVVATFLTMIHSLSHLRGFSSLSYYVTLVIAVTQDLGYFLVIVFIILASFAYSLYLHLQAYPFDRQHSLLAEFNAFMGNYETENYEEGGIRLGNQDTLGSVFIVASVLFLGVVLNNLVINILGRYTAHIVYL
jgi:ankyrin repeat protein